MRASTFWLEVDDGVKLFVRLWEPDQAVLKAAVLIAHGLAEHSGRYARVAEALTAAGYAVYAYDHRGHGRTAQSPDDLGYFADHDGFERLVRDELAVTERIARDRPGLPLFAMGHSMGSIITRGYLARAASRLAGVVISGTSAHSTPLARAGLAIGKLERLRVGPRGHSKLLSFAALDVNNLLFRPARTRADWLSRDPAEVDKYLADPLCGFPLRVQGWLDVFTGLLAIERDDEIAKLPKDLPFYVFAGAVDPVGGDTGRGRWFLEALQRAGMRDVTHRFYPEARHETLNELNRAEVERDLVTWLDGVLARRAGAVSGVALGS